MKQITIAIDGYSSTGKSTLAKRLASALNYVYVDTGAMYRAVTLFALNNNYLGAKEDIPSFVKQLPNIKLTFVPNETSGLSEMYLNGQNVEKEIRTMKVSEQVSKIATIAEVRSKLVEMQQQMGEEKGIVMDGRDIGTVVFPNAELKIFMTASPETRAARRYKELLERGEEVTFEEVLNNVQKRDRIDSTREISPLKKAKDAIEFDNSDMGVEEQFERIYNFTQRIISAA
ncbi:(d)CMP kinase [Flagellimonas eckloniae]|uniref:Cytidylate kinase n=1 Tax=Flagellimonas eckloniae TaxID=346185 RepID=A0A0Q0XE51_9FLAO|nr:(d)CMP kinase [Allomuricauda eckloniae]KQC29437.1 cytidylate kinase [Allomuricauda eckloniae]